MKKYLFFICLFIFSLAIRSGNSPENDIQPKIVICHIPPGNSDNAHAIEISVNALPAHLAHGDFIGDCEVECDDGECDD